MSGLNDLNTYGDIPVTYTDLRTASVKFDRTTSVDQTVPYRTNINFILPAGINITSITLPDVEQVYFQVNVTAISGATVTWSVLPAGYTVTTPSTGVYRISNIKNKSDWDIIKNAIITPPANYANSFNVSATIGYETIKSYSWNTVAQITQSATLQVSTSLTAKLSQGTVRFNIRMYSSFMLPNTQARKARTLVARLQSRSTLSSVGAIRRLVLATGSWSQRSYFTAAGPFVFVLPLTAITMSANTTAVANSVVYYLLVGLDSTTYNANDATQIAPNGQVNPYDAGTNSYTVTLNLGGSGGLWGSQSAIGATSTVSYTGTSAQVSAWLKTVYYYPVKNLTTPAITYTWSIAKNGTVQKSGSRILTYNTTTTNIVYDLSTLGYTGTWTPSGADVYYRTKMDYVLVGHGGASSTYAGGAGGNIVYVTNTSITGQFSYNYTIGQAGSGASTTFNGYTAAPGAAGSNTWPYYQGGGNGSYVGGYGQQYVVPIAVEAFRQQGISYDIGGGGAGGSADGGSAVLTANGTYTGSNPPVSSFNPANAANGGAGSSVGNFGMNFSAGGNGGGVSFDKTAGFGNMQTASITVPSNSAPTGPGAGATPGMLGRRGGFSVTISASPAKNGTIMIRIS